MNQTLIAFLRDVRMLENTGAYLAPIPSAYKEFYAKLCQDALLNFSTVTQQVLQRDFEMAYSLDMLGAIKLEFGERTTILPANFYQTFSELLEPICIMLSIGLVQPSSEVRLCIKSDETPNVEELHMQQTKAFIKTYLEGLYITEAAMYDKIFFKRIHSRRNLECNEEG